MKAFVLILGLFCLASPVAGADSTAPGPANGAVEWRQFFPSAEDSRWVYRFTNHQTDAHSTITIRAHRGQQVGDLKMTDPHVFEENRGDERAPIVYFQDAQGYLAQFLDASYGPADELRLPPHSSDALQILPPQLTAGVEWIQHAVTVGRVRWTHKVVVAENVTVPAGSFGEAYRIEATVDPEDQGDVTKVLGNLGMFDFRYTDWYVKDVGLVKSTTTMLRNGAAVATQELESYTLAPRTGQRAVEVPGTTP